MIELRLSFNLTEVICSGSLKAGNFPLIALYACCVWIFRTIGEFLLLFGVGSTPALLGCTGQDIDVAVQLPQGTLKSMHKQFSGRLFSNWFSGFFRQAVRNPKYRLWMIAGLIVYLLSPLDIFPDVFPIIGWIDDGAIVTLLAAEMSQFLLERRKLQKEQIVTVDATQSVA